METSAYKVWQRVLEKPCREASCETLYRLAGVSRGAAREYRAMAARYEGAAGQRARELEHWERENLECLRGLFYLSTGRPLPDSGGDADPSAIPEGTVLYRRALAQLQEYTALSAQTNYGVVLGGMAERQRCICEGIARFLGVGIGKQPGSVRR